MTTTPPPGGTAPDRPGQPRRAWGPLRAGPQTIATQPGPGLARYTAGLARKAQRRAAAGLPPGPRGGEATAVRLAELDLRMAGRRPDPDTRLAACAEQVAAIGAHAGPGALQIVCCDLAGATSPGGFDPLAELAGQLASRGVPPQLTARTDDLTAHPERAMPLLAAAIDGPTAVLLATSRNLTPMLAGRAVALHHLDCPTDYRNLARREDALTGSRRERVRTLRYVTAGGQEAACWDTADRLGLRWAPVMQRLCPAALADPHWPVLAGQLDRYAADGQHAALLLVQALAGSPPGPAHPARELDLRLAALCHLPPAPAATPAAHPAPAAPPARPAAPPPAPTPGRAAPRR